MVSLVGCAGGKEEAKVPEGWVTDTVDDLVEFAYPEDFNNPDGYLHGWSNVHASENLLNYVVGNHDSEQKTVDDIEGQFRADTGGTVGGGGTRHTEMEIDGYKTVVMDFWMSEKYKLPARLYMIQIDDDTAVVVGGFFEESRKADLDKVGESIRVLK